MTWVTMLKPNFFNRGRQKALTSQPQAKKKLAYTLKRMVYGYTVLHDASWGWKLLIRQPKRHKHYLIPKNITKT